MQVLDHVKALQRLCESTGKWGIYIGFADVEDWHEVLKAAPYLTVDDAQVLADGSAYILFDTEEEMVAHYGMTVGDDGPTKANPYNGPAKVFALTCNPMGETLYENT